VSHEDPDQVRHQPVAIADVRAAAERLRGVAVRTPLLRLEAEGVGAEPAEVWLKLENLQPIGSFKIRGAANAVALAASREVSGRSPSAVWTASAGNMAQGVAWVARQRGLSCAVVVPESAPRAKLDAIERLGARTVKVPFDVWLEVFRTRQFEGMDGLFIHPFSDPDVMAGNGTIGLEILEDLPAVDVVIVPYGGGGLSCGIAAATRALKPGTEVYASEIETAAPLAPSFEAGRPVSVEYEPSFVDGIGAPVVFPEMFELAQELLAGSLVVSLDETAEAIRLLAGRAHVVAEGAGATSLAAALHSGLAERRVVCVISGGNIDLEKLATILAGGQS
jgi:threonine dehydratase